MKKIIAFLVVLCLCVSLVACSSDNSSSSSVIGTTQSTDSAKTTETHSDDETPSTVPESEPVESKPSEPSVSTNQESSTSSTTAPNTVESNTTSDKATTPTTKEPEKTESTTTTSKPIKEPEPPKYETFAHTIGIYTIQNLEKQKGSDDYYAHLSSYTLDKSETYRKEFIAKFASAFGYEPTAEIVCKTLGTYHIDGLKEPMEVYEFYINDDTYPLITDEFYLVKKKICADGSAWVGFPIPCSMDNMESSTRVSKLLTEMNNTFCNWTGYDYSYISQNKDKFMVNMISEAGKMRTLDGKVTDVIYRYTRGVNMPIDKQ